MDRSIAIGEGGARSRLNPAQIVGTLLVAVVLFFIYLVLDLRAGGRQQTVLSTTLSSPADLAHMFGPAFLAAALVLDAALALATASLLRLSWIAFKERRGGAGVGACSTGTTTILGVATFACPGCTVPIIGTLGISFAASSLPLYGLEFKVLGLAIVVGTLVWIQRRGRRLHENPAREAR